MTQATLVVSSQYEANVVKEMVNFLTSNEVGFRYQLCHCENKFEEIGMSKGHISDMYTKLINTKVIISKDETPVVEYQPAKAAILYGEPSKLDRKAFKEAAERLLETECSVVQYSLWNDHYDYLIASKLYSVADGLGDDIGISGPFYGIELIQENCLSVMQKALSGFTASVLPEEYNIGIIELVNERVSAYEPDEPYTVALAKKWSPEGKPQLTGLLQYINYRAIGNCAYKCRTITGVDKPSVEDPMLQDYILECAKKCIPDQLVLEFNPMKLYEELGYGLEFDKIPSALYDMKNFISEVKLLVFKNFLEISI